LVGEGGHVTGAHLPQGLHLPADVRDVAGVVSHLGSLQIPLEDALHASASLVIVQPIPDRKTRSDPVAADDPRSANRFGLGGIQSLMMVSSTCSMARSGSLPSASVTFSTSVVPSFPFSTELSKSRMRSSLNALATAWGKERKVKV